MRVLVIFCHPDRTSFASALHGMVIETLCIGGHDVTDLDLYREGFNPILSLQERAQYANGAVHHDTVRKYADQLASADGLVVVYPAWWYGMPAMLKGYFDRVWAPGIAYDVLPGGGVETKRLARIRRVAIITTYGGPWWLIRVYMGDPARKLWSRGVRQLCGKGCKLDIYVHYNMDRAKPSRLAKFLIRIKRQMEVW
jgi:NAD(P)H dehydrogenase (quinone)